METNQSEIVFKRFPAKSTNDRSESQALRGRKNRHAASAIRHILHREGVEGEPRRLSLFKDKRWSADASPFQVNRHLDAIGNLDKRNPAVHPIVLAVEGHRPFDRA